MKTHINLMDVKNVILSKMLPILGIFIMFLTASCKDSLLDSVYQTSDIPMIDEYLENPANGLSEFGKIVALSKYKGMLHAYGTYTCFAPTDNAIEEYMASINKTIDQLSQEEASEIVGYHVISHIANSDGSTPQAITSLSFVDGRLSTVNLTNYFLIIGIETDENGAIYYEVDKKARITKKDINKLGNGIIHTVDVVLEKPMKTLKQQIEELPDERFSILKGYFKESEVYTSILGAEVSEGKYYTVFLHDNESFIEEDLDTRDKLLAELRKNNSGAVDEKELIEDFVSYHIGDGRKFVIDLMTISSLNTLAITSDSKESEIKNYEILSIQRNKNNEILINEFKVGEYDEPGIPVVKNSIYADLNCTNGITQEINGVIQIRKKGAYRVNFDLTEQPEFVALPDFRKELTEKRQFKAGTLSEITWTGSNVISYLVSTSWYSAYTSKEQYVYGDYMAIRLGTNNAKYLEFKTPYLINGTYKVWLCYYSDKSETSSGTPQFTTTFKQEGQDNQVLSTTIASKMPIKYRDDKVDHEAMEQEGWKQYTAREVHTNMASRLIGTIQVNATGRHTIRFDAMNQASSNIQFDMLQFIPVDEDQVWPMIDMAGNMIYEDTPASEIWPYN